MTRILFICHGNICRSPMAEFIMKALVKEKRLENEYYIESAAVSREEIGNGIYPPAKRCLSAHGIAYDPNKTARQVTRADYERFDRLVYMDDSNRWWLKRIFPEDSEGKISLMLSHAGLHRDVADPWYTGDFEATYRDLTLACGALLEGR